IDVYHQELIPWARYNSLKASRWSPYIAGGLGVFRDIANVEFYNNSEKFNGRWQWLVAAAVGSEIKLISWLKLEAEIRGIHQFVTEKSIPGFNLRVVASF